MADNVLAFPYGGHPTQPIAQFIRLGEAQYQSLGNLLAAGKLKASRVVVDASKIRHQRELIRAFREAGAEIVLDTKAVELASPLKIAGAAKGAPWADANDGDVVGPQCYIGTRGDDLCRRIAQCAVEYQIDAVLAPAHFIGDKLFNGWFDLDRQVCERLRRALDEEGGAHIAIDYPLILPHVMLNDPDRRSGLADGLQGLPFDNLWIRASGFGNDAGPLTVTRYMDALSGLHNVGHPIVADYLGGVVGEAAISFGTISGIAHGIAERERFNTTGWEKPPRETESGFGGRATRVPLGVVNRSFNVAEFELLCLARGGRRLLLGNDRSRTSGGVQEVLRDPRGFAAQEVTRHLETLSGVPDLHRGQHFLDRRMAEVARTARSVKDLKPPQEKAKEKNIDLDKLMTRLNDHSSKTDKLQSALERQHEELKERAGRAMAVTRASAGSEARGWRS